MPSIYDIRPSPALVRTSPGEAAREPPGPAPRAGGYRHRRDIARRLFGGEVETIVLGFDRPNIRLSVELKRDWKRRPRTFVAGRRGQSGIVYCLSRKKTEEPADAVAAGARRHRSRVIRRAMRLSW